MIGNHKFRSTLSPFSVFLYQNFCKPLGMSTLRERQKEIVKHKDLPVTVFFLNFANRKRKGSI